MGPPEYTDVSVIQDNKSVTGAHAVNEALLSLVVDSFCNWSFFLSLNSVCF